MCPYKSFTVISIKKMDITLRYSRVFFPLLQNILCKIHFTKKPPIPIFAFTFFIRPKVISKVKCVLLWLVMVILDFFPHAGCFKKTPKLY